MSGGHGDHGDPVKEVLEMLQAKKIRKIFKDHNKAHASYGSKDAEADNNIDFTNKLVAYFKHHKEKTVGKGAAGTDDQAILGEARQLLDAAYEDKGGYTYAMKHATKEAGLQDVFTAIRDVMANRQVAQYTSGAKSKIDPLDPEQHVKVIKHIQKQLGSLDVDDELVNQNPELMAHKWSNAIDTYSKILQQYESSFMKDKPHDAHAEHKKTGTHGGH